MNATTRPSTCTRFESLVQEDRRAERDRRRVDRADHRRVHGTREPERGIEQQGVAGEPEHRLQQVQPPFAQCRAPVRALDEPGDRDERQERERPAEERERDRRDLARDHLAEHVVARPEEVRERQEEVHPAAIHQPSVRGRRGGFDDGCRCSAGSACGSPPARHAVPAQGAPFAASGTALNVALDAGGRGARGRRLRPGVSSVAHDSVRAAGAFEGEIGHDRAVHRGSRMPHPEGRAMTPPDAEIVGRGELLVGPSSSTWMPPSTGRELARAMIVGAGEDSRIFTLRLGPGVDLRRVVVFVRIGSLLCTVRPRRVDDAFAVALPFSLGRRNALAVVVECETEAEADELVRRYDAERAAVEDAGPAPSIPPVTRSAPPPSMPAPSMPAPSAPPPPPMPAPPPKPSRSPRRWPSRPRRPRSSQPASGRAGEEPPPAPEPHPHPHLNRRADRAAHDRPRARRASTARRGRDPGRGALPAEPAASRGDTRHEQHCAVDPGRSRTRAHGDDRAARVPPRRRDRSDRRHAAARLTR